VLGRVSLRTRLVLGVIVLAALGLAVADIATYTSLRSFLFHRTDVSLDAAHPGVERALFQQHGPGPGLPLVDRGPYRWMRHPNYVAVVLEGIALPLVHTAWITAVVFTMSNAGLLRVRISAENAAMAQALAETPPSSTRLPQ